MDIYFPDIRVTRTIDGCGPLNYDMPHVNGGVDTSLSAAPSLSVLICATMKGGCGSQPI